MQLPTPGTSALYLEVPARPTSLQVVRIAATASAAEILPDVNALDDLRLSVDELSILLVEVAGPDDSLTMRVWHAPPSVLIEGRVLAGDGSALREPSEVATMLLSTVADEHELIRDGNDLVFRLCISRRD